MALWIKCWPEIAETSVQMNAPPESSLGKMLVALSLTLTGLKEAKTCKEYARAAVQMKLALQPIVWMHN